MIPAHLLDLERSISFTPVKMEMDGGVEGVSPSFDARNQHRTEALFSDVSSHYTGYEGYFRERFELGRIRL